MNTAPAPFGRVDLTGLKVRASLLDNVYLAYADSLVWMEGACRGAGTGGASEFGIRAVAVDHVTLGALAAQGDLGSQLNLLRVDSTLSGATGTVDVYGPLDLANQGNAGGATSINGGAAIVRERPGSRDKDGVTRLVGSSTADLNTIQPGESGALNVPVPGAVAGMIATVSVKAEAGTGTAWDPGSWSVQSYVVTTNVVTVRLTNITDAAINLAPISLRARAESV